MPSRRNRTPRRLNASKSARSAGVSAKSSTGETTAKALRRLKRQAAERVVDVAWIDSGMPIRDLMGAPPERLGLDRQAALRLCQTVEHILMVAAKRLGHVDSMP